MIQNCNIHRVLKVFLDDPLKGFRLREIARILKLGLPSVSRYIKELEKAKLIIKKVIYANKLWFGNKESRLFKIYKKFETIISIEQSELIQYLDEKLNLPTIVLYGSHALGDDRKESDIDLFIITSSKENLKIEQFEKTLGKKLHLFIHTEDEFKKIKINNKELTNNVLNGIVLSGYLKVL
ncbi:MAG: nucleotidyltransferase domain-containing protein [Nanoarchaeota archaeon]|nr:nucleotidyltransferase domain-containing protein [Nanoarchaeota archaeon]